ncbi:MAG: hypothetical protein ABRQ27_14215 [Clostridiaceae bacterium]
MSMKTSGVGYEHIAIISDKRDRRVMHNSYPTALEVKLSWFQNAIHG